MNGDERGGYGGTEKPGGGDGPRYADLGHSGRRPIQIAWYFVVFPALLINCFGQGALLLERGTAVGHPFFGLVNAFFSIPVDRVVEPGTRIGL